MGWETRRGGKRFYYRKLWYRDEQGRPHVKSVYCGSGEQGEAAAREDEERRRAASLSKSAPRATDEEQPAPAHEESPHPTSARAFADALRCTADSAAVASTRAEESDELRPETDLSLSHWRSLIKPPTAAAVSRRYRRRYGSDNDPNRFPWRRRP